MAKYWLSCLGGKTQLLPGSAEKSIHVSNSETSLIECYLLKGNSYRKKITVKKLFRILSGGF